MSKPELKPCPFCGKPATLTHGEIEKIPTANRPTFTRGDYIIEWSISCQNCGMAKIKKVGKYVLNYEGNLISVDEKDVRDKVISLWNRRTDDEQSSIGTGYDGEL